MPNHHNTPLVTEACSGEVTVTDPAHPLFGRTFVLFGLARLPGCRQTCQVEVFPDEITYIDVASTNLSTAPRTTPTRLTLDAVGELVNTFEDIFSRREADDAVSHGNHLEAPLARGAAEDRATSHHHSSGGTQP
ncbi:hypothetical protein [Thalassoroseus pseudoceratinae]|uniref:hypothetical protein n=1 Tax=Thalassoroseus pseudoceratinae TaxID=2713176 RepID=UPI00141D9845|nr:hypothetical protein [Thalassoroseus pseudoceratinae]